jgi:hypothetical protein
LRRHHGALALVGPLLLLIGIILFRYEDLLPETNDGDRRRPSVVQLEVLFNGDVRLRKIATGECETKKA